MVGSLWTGATDCSRVEWMLSGILFFKAIKEKKKAD
jgi:hypothetical protein